MDLLEACRKSPDRVKELIKRGADVNVSDNDGDTPLHLACWRQPSVVECLVQNGAKVNIENIFGNTPLHFACRHQPSVVEFLVQHGAKVNIENNFGNTPFHYACESQPSVVRILYDRFHGPLPQSHELDRVIALYSAMIWKRSNVGGLPSHVMVQYLV
jgi:ankyrin repeat protein